MFPRLVVLMGLIVGLHDLKCACQVWFNCVAGFKRFDSFNVFQLLVLIACLSSLTCVLNLFLSCFNCSNSHWFVLPVRVGWFKCSPVGFNCYVCPS